MIERSCIVGGKRLETAHIPGRDPAIVMLHEGLGSLAHWKDFPKRLASESGASVFVYSRYGQGNSDRLRESARTSSLMQYDAY